MRHRLRSVIWRELPYSARRSIVGVLRTFDDFEDFCIRLWLSLHYSPAWIFVAAAGSVGIGLTILLFFMLAQELLADQTPAVKPVRPVIESVALADHSGLIDSRLCIEPTQPPPQSYPAEFLQYDGILMTDYAAPAPRRSPLRRVEPAAPSVEPEPTVEPDFPDLAGIERRPPSRRPPSRQRDLAVQPTSDVQMLPVEMPEEPELSVSVDAWRQPAIPQPAPESAQILTARSEATEFNPHRQSDWPRVNDLWTWFRERPASRQEIIPYVGIPRLEPEVQGEQFWENFTAWPNRTDVGLDVKLFLPESSTAGKPQQTRLVVQNIGVEPIRRVEIQEPVRLLDEVTDATPPASLNDHILYRELYRLAAGAEKVLRLDWTPPYAGDRHYEARILAETYVAASVNVTRPPSATITETMEERQPEPAPPPRRAPVVTPAITVEPVDDFAPPPAAERRPTPPVPVAQPVREEPPPTEPPPTEPRRSALACRVQGNDRVPVNGIAELSIQVENTGETAIDSVEVWADLPENLWHRHGQTLKMDLGTLRPGEQRQTVLRLVGGKVGLSYARIQAIADEVESPNANAFLAVIPASSEKTKQSPGCVCPCGPQVSFRWKASGQDR